MKIVRLATLVLFACLGASTATAQSTKPSLVDSANKQLLRNAKPGKRPGASASVNAATAQAKTGTSAKTKPARVADIPAIVSPGSGPAPKAARVAAPSDTGPKPIPAVSRSPKVAKNKPPAK